MTSEILYLPSLKDRELLEMAAKAAGITIYCDQYEGNNGSIWCGFSTDAHGWHRWNPLSDDGDALRLAVKVGLELSLFGIEVTASKGSRACAQVFAGDDRPAASRRAIVEAAAGVWRNREGAAMSNDVEPSDDQFRSMVRYFWEKKEDPTAFLSWDSGRCERLMPAFYAAWIAFKEAQEAAWAAIAVEAW